MFLLAPAALMPRALVRFLLRRIIDATLSDKNGQLYLVLLDLSKAFDCIKHSALLAALNLAKPGRVSMDVLLLPMATMSPKAEQLFESRLETANSGIPLLKADSLLQCFIFHTRMYHGASFICSSRIQC